jgi:hypothetical protein
MEVHMSQGRHKLIGVMLLAIAACALLVAVPMANAKRVRISSRTTTFNGGDANVDPQRLETRCKRGLRPVGGGVYGSPSVGADGIGVFPSSSERLGSQEGWHATTVLFDNVSRSPASRKVTMQAFCTKLKGDLDSVSTNLLVDPGDYRTAVATCPKGKTLLTGGHLSTQFFLDKGVYITESRRIDDRSWEATAYGILGGKGGYVTALAYCIGGRRATLTETSATVDVPAHGVATAQAPACPRGKPLGVGGFLAPSNGALRIFDPYSPGGGVWSVSAYGVLGPGQLTSYGYCLLRTRGPRGNHDKIFNFSSPIVYSSFRQPPSPHGASYSVDVTGRSVGKIRGDRSNGKVAKGCLANRKVTLEPRYRDPVTGPINAGATVVTHSDGNGEFSAKVPVTVPARRTPPAQLSVLASFSKQVTRKIGGKRVACESGGELHPAYQPVGA